MALTKHDRVQRSSEVASISSAVKTSPEPRTAEEMYLDLLKRSLGTLQLDQMQFCITDVCDRGIPGDLLEAGVW
jgi:hypothetical protein